MIKTLFFDFDGVLTTDPSGSATTLRALAEQSGLDEQVLWAAIEPFNRDLILGHTTHARIWPDVCVRLGIAIPFEHLTTAFLQTPIHQPVLALARELRAEFAIGMITDNKSDRMDVIVKQHRLDEVFDPIVVSAEVGHSKRGAAIFREALRRAGAEARTSLFIDNTLRNLYGAAAIGMKTLLFDGTTESAAELRSALQLIFTSD